MVVLKDMKGQIHGMSEVNILSLVLQTKGNHKHTYPKFGLAISLARF